MKLEFSYDVCVCVCVCVWAGGYAKKPKHFQKHEGREVKICIFFAKVHSRRSQKKIFTKTESRRDHKKTPIGFK